MGREYLLLVIVLCSCLHSLHCQEVREEDELSRKNFPKGFVFGTSSSAFQYEGAVSEGGRGPSVWDPFSHTDNIIDGSNADVSVDQYHRYKEDIDLMVDLGIDAYRLSISWTRILPNGTGTVNPEGIKYYNNLINALLKKGIKPYVTLGHFDHPQALQDAYDGMLNPQIVKDFAIFAETCFAAFGDRVKHWITLNEPHTITNYAYNFGLGAPPLRCSPDIGNEKCLGGDSSTEPYIVGHHYLLSHAAAIDIYKKKFKEKQGGFIGITLDGIWYEPLNPKSQADIRAAERARQFNLGWMMDPVIFGEYPKTMRVNVGDKLPKFTKEESRILREGSDFVGINHYTSLYVADPNTPNLEPAAVPDFNQPAYYKHTKVYLTDERNGKPIGKKVKGNNVYPPGMKGLLKYIKKRYNNPTIFITENGLGDDTTADAPLYEVLNDEMRITYLQGHLSNVAAAIREGCDVRGYFIWSLMDNWEWNSGRSIKYGLYHIDFKANLTRIPKKSSGWYKKVIAKVGDIQNM